MNDEGPCMLPHHKERLQRSYEAELDHYAKTLERLDKLGADEPKAVAMMKELEVKRDTAEKRLRELSHIPVCEPTTPEPAAPVEAAAPDAPAPQTEPQPL